MNKKENRMAVRQTEHLIQGLIQRIRKSYLITERDQRLLEQRVSSLIEH